MQTIAIAEPEILDPETVEAVDTEVLALGDASPSRPSGRRWYAAPFSSIAHSFRSALRAFAGFLGF